jgi:hypothetical protein
MVATAKGKWPFLRFATGDYWNDPGVQSLDHWDKGVWLEILFLMHQSEDRGRLVLNGNPMSDLQIARAIGLPLNGQESYEGGVFMRPFHITLATILQAKVADRDETGALVNRRMVRDEILRQRAVETGRMGGNPNLLHRNGDTPQREQQGLLASAPPTPQPTGKRRPPDEEALPGESEQDRRTRVSRQRREREASGAEAVVMASSGRGTRLTEDWQISPSLAAYIRDKAPGISVREVERLREDFIDFWTNLPGRDAYKLDWDKTFKTKFRKYLDSRGGYNRGGGRGQGSDRINPGEFLKQLDEAGEEGEEGPGEDEERAGEA